MTATERGRRQQKRIDTLVRQLVATDRERAHALFLVTTLREAAAAVMREMLPDCTCAACVEMRAVLAATERP